MADPPNTTTFGATLESSEPSTKTSTSIHTTETTEDANTISTSDPATKTNNARFSAIDSSSNPQNPFSAFYQHPSTRSSLERAKADSRTSLPLNKSKQKAQSTTDLEKGSLQPAPPAIIVTEQEGDYAAVSNSSVTQSRNTSTDEGRKLDLSATSSRRSEFKTVQSQSSVWPTRRELEEKALLSKRERMRRNWNCLSGLSRKQRLWVKVLIGLFILAAAVGIGVGISFAVGGGVYKGVGQQTTIQGSG